MTFISSPRTTDFFSQYSPFFWCMFTQPITQPQWQERKNTQGKYFSLLACNFGCVCIHTSSCNKLVVVLVALPLSFISFSLSVFSVNWTVWIKIEMVSLVCSVWCDVVSNLWNGLIEWWSGLLCSATVALPSSLVIWMNWMQRKCNCTHLPLHNALYLFSLLHPSESKKEVT